MSNISSIILGHEKNLFSSTVTQYACNCWIRKDWPLQNEYLTPNITYTADAHCEANKDYKFYFGVAETPFKERFWSHNRDLNHKQYIESPELSKYICSLKDAETPYHQMLNSCKNKK